MGPWEDNGDAERGEPRLPWETVTQYDGPEASTPGSSDMDVRSELGDAENHRHTLPVWLRESSNSFHWKWIPVHIRQTARAAVAWSKGPDPPHIQKIEPFLPYIQKAPVNFIEKYFPKTKHKAGLLATFYFCWLLTFTLVLHHSAQAGKIKGYGKPQGIWCGASFW